MRISDLDVSNFKGIEHAELRNLGDVVLIAGPNGSGKSCLYDAIRLLKSAYGGYRKTNEWQQFFGEYQLDLNRPNEFLRIFFDKKLSVNISATFQLSLDEKEYIRKNVDSLVREVAFRETFGLKPRSRFFANIGQDQETLNRVEMFITQFSEKIINDLEKAAFEASLIITPEGGMDTVENAMLHLVFAVYDPNNIGIVDYHSANRTYQRERFSNIRVDIAEAGDRLAQSALYNLQNKYSNVKEELAAALVRDLISEKAGSKPSEVPSILDTLSELFEQLIPGKRFDGPQPSMGGELAFPVKLANGKEHDIDDLSSGEKELVYGYLRIRNVSPKNSIIMIDEPELHLNPRLVSGMPRFYQRHIGKDLGNQLWMVTHSDAFLRDAFRDGGFSIFHLNAPTDGDNQATAVEVFDDVQRLVVDLAGNMAGFRPDGKVVIFESSENAALDALIVSRLFPEFAAAVNTISGENKNAVRQLYDTIDRVGTALRWPLSIYAVTDRDDVRRGEEGSNRGKAEKRRRLFVWDAYHIENYLLEEKYIARAVEEFASYSGPMSEADIKSKLKECARETLDNLVAHEIRVGIHGALVGKINLNAGTIYECDPLTEAGNRQKLAPFG